LQQSYSAAFIEGIQHAELLNNAIMALIAPELYDVGLSAIIKTMDGIEMAKHYENVRLWPSIFTGIEVIVNRLTPPHRDKGGCPSHMDLLVSTGTHKQASIDFCELGLSLSYSPGTMVALSGRVFLHEVMKWEEGERVCFAHFMKDAVHLSA
jgi:hypothetical protein